MKSFKAVLFFWILLITGLVLAQDREKLEKENAAIDRRAKEIEAFLSDEPFIFGAPWSDRAAWGKIAQLSGKGKIIKIAEKLLKKPIEDNSEDLYKEFFKNGNRTHYQKALGQWTGRLSTLALAEGIEHKGRFIPALEELIRKFCAYPSWVLPAHDRNAEIFDGKVVYSDLSSTALGQEFGIILSWAQKDLSPETVDLLKKNIEVRVLEPYRICVKEGTKAGKRSMWWIRGTNNWNSVCHAGTIGAALTTVPSKADRAWFIAAAEYCTGHYFFAGFTSDGYCSEGMGYWNYGFGNFVYLASAIRQATAGKVDLFKNPMVVKCTRFAPGMEVAGRKYAAFADCSIKATPAPVFMNYLSRTCGLNLDFYEKAGMPQNTGYGLTELAYFLFDPYLNAGSSGVDSNSLVSSNTEGPASAAERKMAKKENAESVNAPVRTDFDVAGVLICRPDPKNKKKTLAIAMKGGHNNEQHNHNDVGSYSLALVTYDKNGNQKADYMVLDPGGEIYTRRTFSKDRYVGQLLNSFGHPVPLVNGHLQKTGAAARGVVLEKVFSPQKDQFVIDMTSAYSYPGVKSVVRAFTYYRNVSPEILSMIPQNKEGKTSGSKDCVEIDSKAGQNATGALVIEDRIELDSKESVSNFAVASEPESISAASLGSKVSKKSKKLSKMSEKSKESQINEKSRLEIDGGNHSFESALITFMKAEVKDQGDSLTVRIGQNEGVMVYVAVFDEKGIKVPVRFEEQIVGQNDDSVPNKPTRLAFGPKNPLRKGTIRFIFLP